MRLPDSFSGGQLTLLQGGLTNQSYQLKLPRGDFFLRVSTPFAARLGIKRGYELVLHKLAAEHELAPRLHFVDPEQGLLISDWVEPCTETVDWHVPESIKQLAQLTYNVHALPAPALRLDLEAHLRFYLARICNRDPRITRLFYSMVERLQSLPPHPAVFCHNDISPANLLGDPLRLVDWEYAGVGDPAFDLACLIRAFAFSESEARLLLDAYQGLGGCCPWGRIEEMLRIADFVAVLWANVFWESSNEVSYKNMFEQRLSELCVLEGVS